MTGRARRWAVLALLALIATVAEARAPVTLAEAKKLARTVSFKPVVDDIVLAELNALVATADGRKRMREGLARFADFREVVERELAAQSVPLVMAALPLVESGYENLPDLDKKGECCAGLWQLRRDTARALGLKVTKTLDERRIASKASAAAAKLLADNYRVFSDWTLAVAAYQAGAGGLGDAIAKAKTRDVAALMRGKHLSTYTAKAIAAMIVLTHPRLVD